MKIDKLEINHRDTTLEISYLDRPGAQPGVLFLPGLMCNKTDGIEATKHGRLKDFRLVSIDYPGIGGSSAYPENVKFGIDDLAHIAGQVATKLEMPRHVVMGHSMGGVVASRYAQLYRDKIYAVVNIEGNFTPDDCFFSGQFAEVALSDMPDVRARIAQTLLDHSSSGMQRFGTIFANAALLPLQHYAESLVASSAKGDLIASFNASEVPRLFIHGSETGLFDYLPQLRAGGSQVARVDDAHHFSFIDNPEGFSKIVTDFIRREIIDALEQ